MEQCWNEIGTALKISRLTSLAHLPDPECPKSGLEGVERVITQQGASGHTSWGLFIKFKVVKKIGPGALKVAKRGRDGTKYNTH